MVALLRIAVLKMSLYDRGATYGSNLQNLKYRNEWKHPAGAREFPGQAPYSRLSVTSSTTERAPS